MSVASETEHLTQVGRRGRGTDGLLEREIEEDKVRQSNCFGSKAVAGAATINELGLGVRNERQL